MGARRFQCAHDFYEHAFRVAEDVVVPEPDRAEASMLKPCVSIGIDPFAVLAAVNLDNKRAFDAGEIGDVRTHGVLPTKSTATKLPAS